MDIDKLKHLYGIHIIMTLKPLFRLARLYENIKNDSHQSKTASRSLCIHTEHVLVSCVVICLLSGYI